MEVQETKYEFYFKSSLFSLCDVLFRVGRWEVSVGNILAFHFFPSIKQFSPCFLRKQAPKEGVLYCLPQFPYPAISPTAVPAQT